MDCHSRPMVFALLIVAVLAAGSSAETTKSVDTKESVVTGIVTDQAGVPLPHVRWRISAVETWSGAEDGHWELLFCTGAPRQGTTDKQGRFKLRFRGKARYDLQFDKAPYGPVFLYQVANDSPPLVVKMREGIIVRGRVVLPQSERPDYDGLGVTLRLPNPRDFWYKTTTRLSHEGKFGFHASPSPEVPGFADKPQWQLVCGGEIVKLDIREDAPVDKVVFEVRTTSKKISADKKERSPQS